MGRRLQAVLQGALPYQPYPVTSSSGPVRKVAPASLAFRTLVLILPRFPVQSRANWFREQVAIVVRGAMLRMSQGVEVFTS